MSDVETVRLAARSASTGNAIGPLLLPFDAALRPEGLMVGRCSIGTRLGYVRRGVRGPWLLRAMFTALERRARHVPWDDVLTWDRRTVRVGERREELGPITLNATTSQGAPAGTKSAWFVFG